MTRLLAAAVLALASVAVLASARSWPTMRTPPPHLAATISRIDDPRAAFVRPKGLPPALAPTQAAVDLGRQLFHDTRLSKDGTMSCATCHQPQLAFADGQSHHHGRNGQPLARHTPKLWNLAWGETLYWDGRAKTLE